MPNLVLPVLKCLRCKDGYEWIPRSTKLPVTCPKCKSPNWNKKKEGKK